MSLEAEETGRGTCLMTTEAESGVTHLQAMAHWPPPEAARGKAGSSPWSFQRAQGPAHAVISDFSLQNCETTFCCFYRHPRSSLCHFVKAAIGKEHTLPPTSLSLHSAGAQARMGNRPGRVSSGTTQGCLTEHLCMQRKQKKTKQDTWLNLNFRSTTNKLF